MINSAMLFDILGSAVSICFGIAVFYGLLYLIYSRHAFRWRRLEHAYQRPLEPTDQKRHMQGLVLYGGRAAYTSYYGVLTIGLYSDGMGLSVLPPLSIFQKPLFIPYQDVKGWSQQWYLNAKSIELQFAKVPEIKIIMPAEQIAWIRENSIQSFGVSTERPAHNAWPAFTYLTSIAAGSFGLVMLVWFFVGLL